MKNTATIALVVLLVATIGATVFLVLDQKDKQKQLADKENAIKSLNKQISVITANQKKAGTELSAAQAAHNTVQAELSKLQSENSLLQVKISSAESKLAAQVDGSSEAVAKIQGELDALKAEADATATKLAAAEASNSALETQIAVRLEQVNSYSNALSKAEAQLQPFLDLDKSPQEIILGLKQRPVLNVPKPLPPRPAIKAGKITKPLDNPAPNPLKPAPSPPTSP